MTESTDRSFDSATYADYELKKVNPSELVQLKVKDSEGGATNWMTITEETLEKVAEVLRNSPEGKWG